MNTELLIVADRGQLKAYTVNHPGGRDAMPELVDNLTIEEARNDFADRFTDQAGAFPDGATRGQGNSMAERLPLREEEETRIFRKLAEHVEKVVRQHDPARWSFAAPSEINGAILDGVADDCRKTLAQNVPKDLVKIPVAELLGHFQKS